MKEYDIIIVGAGPAGSAAAIQIANHAPEVAQRTLVLEKGVFPRHKLCGGGVTTHADALLAQLGVSLDVWSFPIHAVRILYEDIAFTIPWPNIFRVVRREEFDTALARCAQERGVELRQGEALVDFERDEQGVAVQTRQGEYRARVVIGADGANSVVRTKLGLVRWDRVSRLLEILTPVDATRTHEFIEHTAVFDFTPTGRGIQGYYWDFPSSRQGLAAMNRGIFDSRVHPERARPSLKPVLQELLSKRKVEWDGSALEGHPERWYDPWVKHSAPHILLAGDAAGTEPFMGEGISHALDFGRIAAESALRGLSREDFDFSDYEQHVRWSALGRRLNFKRTLAHVMYGQESRWVHRLFFGTLRVMFGD